MGPVNGHSAHYSFLDRAALLFGRGRIEELLAERGKNGVPGKETARCPSLEAPAQTPQPSPYTEPALNLDVAEVLSPSQINAYLDCTAKWFFKYFRGLPDVINAKRALGTAVHKAQEANFRQKIETKKDLDREQVLEIYALAWKEEAEKARFEEDDNREELERTGAVLVQKYLVEAAPEIIPIAVEHRVSGEIAGVKVCGYVDLMDSNGCIIDLKTSSKKPSEIPPDYKRQVTTYTRLMPGASGKVATHTLVRTKTPQLAKQIYQVTPEDVRHVEIMYPLAQEGMRSGLYTPNRNSMFCSRKSCSFWQACQQEFGGEVAES